MYKKKFIFFIFIKIIYSIPIHTVGKRELESNNNNDIVILHTNDVHCGVMDSIGYDGLMLYKKQLLQKYQNVILVDAGDHLQGGAIGLISNGEAIIDIMNKLEYDVVTLGNHEFDYGVSQLENCAKMLKCGYISCNYCLSKDKKSIYPGYKIIEKGNKKIAFIGISHPHTLSKSNLIKIKDENGKQFYDFLTENHNQKLFNRIQEQINEVKKEGADYVILLAHLGIGGDVSEENTSSGILKNLENIDAIIDGHTHLVYSKTAPDKNGKNIPIVQTGSKLNYIGLLIIHSDGTITHENINNVFYDSNIKSDSLKIKRGNKEVWVDKEMYDYINEIENSFSEILNKVIGITYFDLNINNIGQKLSRKDENSFCNLIADAFRYYGEADISIINSGSVRSDIKEGDITYKDIINAIPFSNDIYIKEITGQTILDALEFGVKSLPKLSPRFPQVSGITFNIDTSIKSSVIVDDDEMFVGVGGERRVYNVTINGKELDINKKYTISSSSFILGGGDGYSMFIPYEIKKTSFGIDNEIVLKYITDILNGVIPDKYKDAEGRIIKTQGKIINQNGSLFKKFYNKFIRLLQYVYK